MNINNYYNSEMTEGGGGGMDNTDSVDKNLRLQSALLAVASKCNCLKKVYLLEDSAYKHDNAYCSDFTQVLREAYPGILWEVTSDCPMEEFCEW